MQLATGTVNLDCARFERRDGKTCRLTRREVALLSYLADRAGQDVGRDELLTDVWGYHPLSTSRAVDTGVARLRRKIEVDPKNPEVLCTAHGDGYRLVVGDGPAESAVPVQPRRVFRLGDRAVDLDGGFVCHGREKICLTGLERKLLLVLADRPQTLIDPRTLARRVGVTGGPSALANLVYRLRSKIEPDPSEPRWLVAVRGQGYRLDVASAPPATTLQAMRTTFRALMAHVGLAGDAFAGALDGESRSVDVQGEAYFASFLTFAALAAVATLGR